jgi:hypothetical protein
MEIEYRDGGAILNVDPEGMLQLQEKLNIPKLPGQLQFISIRLKTVSPSVVAVTEPASTRSSIKFMPILVGSALSLLIFLTGLWVAVRWMLNQLCLI